MHCSSCCSDCACPCPLEHTCRVSLGHPTPGSEIAGSYVHLELQISPDCFPKPLFQFRLPLAKYTCSGFLTFANTRFYQIFFCHLCQSGVSVMMSHCVMICISLTIFYIIWALICCQLHILKLYSSSLCLFIFHQLY